MLSQLSLFTALSVISLQTNSACLVRIYLGRLWHLNFSLFPKSVLAHNSAGNSTQCQSRGITDATADTSNLQDVSFFTISMSIVFFPDKPFQWSSNPVHFPNVNVNVNTQEQCLQLISIFPKVNVAHLASTSWPWPSLSTLSINCSRHINTKWVWFMRWL